MFKRFPLSFRDSFFSHHFEIRYSTLWSFIDQSKIFESRKFKVRGFRNLIIRSIHRFLLVEVSIRCIKFSSKFSRIFSAKIFFSSSSITIWWRRTKSQLPSINDMDDIFHFKFYEFILYLIGPNTGIGRAILFKFTNLFISHGKVSCLMFRSHQNIYPCSFSDHFRI